MLARRNFPHSNMFPFHCSVNLNLIQYLFSHLLTHYIYASFSLVAMHLHQHYYNSIDWYASFSTHIYRVTYENYSAILFVYLYSYLFSYITYCFYFKALPINEKQTTE